ncbi:CRISPR-associated endonuclease Cas1 [Leptolyngbya boryana]|uniref:CRISPR-associated endonuclease Cas1 n=1 Tax=Leptolyngbya boryana TaxID=1184 RepID=UPI003742FB3C
MVIEVYYLRFARWLLLSSRFCKLWAIRQQYPLVCDLLAEFQSSIVDRVVMELLQSRQIVSDDFVWVDQGIFLEPDALERFIQHWDAMLARRVEHLYAGEISYQQCLEVQVQEYIACLLEDQEFYRPMLLKG